MNDGNSYIVTFDDGDEIWATQYDSIDDIGHDLIGKCIVNYHQLSEMVEDGESIVGDMTVKYIVANKYKRRDL